MTDESPLRVWIARLRNRFSASERTLSFCEKSVPSRARNAVYSVRMPNSVESRTISSTSSRVAELVVRLASTRDDARRASLFADRVDQKADLAAGPEPGDEAVARGRLVERQAELEHARRPPIVAPEGELERLLADVLAEQDDLVALEEVGDPAPGSAPGCAGASSISPTASVGIGEHRALEALEDGGDFHFDVLAGEDERGGRPALVGDLLQERRVDVDADAEGEDPPLRAGCPCAPARGWRLPRSARRSPARRS